jgi:general secretion pathway protein D
MLIVNLSFCYIRIVKMIRHQFLLAACIGAFLLVGCESVNTSVESKDLYSSALRPAKEISETELKFQAEDASATIMLEEDGPSLEQEAQFANVYSDEFASKLAGPTQQLNINNMPLPAFIDEIFGEQLGLSFTLEPDVQRLEDLVTLRLSKPVKPSELFKVARRTLAAYGVSIEQQAGLILFLLNTNASANESPLFVRGKALPDVPESHRPVFMLVPLRAINNLKLSGWITKALGGNEITIDGVADTNSLLIYGRPAIVDQALAMVKLFDQPIMRGKYTKVVVPVFSEAAALAGDVVAVLKAEGIDATLTSDYGGVMVLPLKVGNQLALFSSDKDVLDHVVDWIRVLDRKQALGGEEGVFYHRLESASAESVVEVLNKLARSDSDNSESVGSEGGSSGRFIDDPNQNALIYSGSGKDWVGYLEIIRDMDKPAPSVLVEVLLVEVTLNDQESTGVEFLAKSGDVTFSDRGGLSLGGNGMNITLDKAGQTRAVVNAFYRNSRANIRSNPRLMVKSGEEASIDVGNEIPVITSTSQSADTPGAPVLQSIQYRNTGIRLQIRPTVHSSGYVDIELSQELSEAQQTSTSGIDSPTIFKRQLDTTVTLRDGESVLLGGLISQTTNKGDSGVAGLGKIPLLGKLFRSGTGFQDRTELMILVTPYILDSPDEAVEITDKVVEILDQDRL